MLTTNLSKRPGLSVFAGIVCLLLAAAPAEATLLGDIVNCSDNLTTIQCTVASATVGSGIEFILERTSNGEDLISIDVQDSAIVLSVLSDFGSFSGRFTVADLDWVNDSTGEITSATVSAGITGLVDSRLIVEPHSIAVLFSGINWQTGQMATITLTTVHVPEPTIALLLLSGFGMLAVRLRRTIH